MSWDDEDFEVPVASKDTPVLESWDDDFANTSDNEVLDSWDAPEQPKKKAAPAKSPAPTKPSKKDLNNKNKGAEEKVLLEIDTLDPKTRQEILKKAELQADLNNAADLFEGLGVSNEHPKAKLLARENDAMDSLLKKASFTKDTPIESHPLFKECESKKDYENLRKALGTAITSMEEKSSLNYASNLAIDLIRDISKPLAIESIRQTVATLNVLIKDKERQERQARLAKVRGGTATGGAGKKKAKSAKANLGGAFKKDSDIVMDNVDDYDDFNDDDFM
ncbi:Translation initiation factor 3 subunit J component [Hanseniaspora vineae]